MSEPLTQSQLDSIDRTADAFTGYCIQHDVRILLREIERLKRGDFTEEEFQNLCHNFSEADECRFKRGCEEYQRKLFGK
jgi:hypothetical protein